MNDKTRKRIWPVSLIAILGVIAMLAVVWSSDFTCRCRRSRRRRCGSLATA